MRLGQLVSRAAREEGLVVRALPEGDIIAFSPALTVTPAQLDDILDRLLRAVERVRAGISPAA
jgi:L-2,4-diaminobutyrate transaminase